MGFNLGPLIINIIGGGKMLKWLEGKKTYIIMGLGIIYQVLAYFNIIPQDQKKSIEDMANWILGFMGLGTLRLGVDNLKKYIDDILRP